MIWLLVCAGGLIAETLLIVVLGRQATGAFPTLDPAAEGPRVARLTGGRVGPQGQSGAAAGGPDLDE
jgi:hypothetical protein